MCVCVKFYILRLILLKAYAHYNFLHVYINHLNVHIYVLVLGMYQYNTKKQHYIYY